MPKETEGWSPYGLEAIRMAHLRRKRIRALALLFGVLLLSMWFFSTSTTTDTRLSVNGRDTGTGISIDAPPTEERKDYVTVSLSPGAVSRVETGRQAPTETITRTDTPVYSRGAPLPFVVYAYQLAPWLIAAAGLWFLLKKRGKLDEVNYGVYKGAMPYEMITAANQKAVFTRRMQSRSVFGKRRSDHMPSTRQTADEARDE